MSEDKEWSLKGKLYYPTYRHEGELHYKEEDIDTLREKLLEDVDLYFNEWLSEQKIIMGKNIKDIINKRFGVDEV